jgi:hypothetical protein
VAKAALLVARENQKSCVHLHSVTSTRIILAIRCGFGALSGSFRQLKKLEAADNAQLVWRQDG